MYSYWFSQISPESISYMHLCVISNLKRSLSTSNPGSDLGGERRFPVYGKCAECSSS